MSDLKPCPFCGCKPQVNTWTMHGITESRCFCSNSDCPNSVRTVALEQWNTRPIEDELCARIAELEAERHWIPVSESLPELDQDVLAIVEGDIVTGHFYQQFDGEIYFDSEEDAMLIATHWMPLPEPPEVQE